MMSATWPALLSALVVLAVSGSTADVASAQQPVEHGSKRAAGLEITLLSAPPLSPAEVKKQMPGMEGMQGMEGMGRMSGETPTHWIGVVVRDLKTDSVVRDAEVTLTARKGEITRTAKLMPMPGSYGANINLPQRGRYVVTVSVVQAGEPHRVGFDFDYR